MTSEDSEDAPNRYPAVSPEVAAARAADARRAYWRARRVTAAFYVGPGFAAALAALAGAAGWSGWAVVVAALLAAVPAYGVYACPRFVWAARMARARRDADAVCS